MDYEQAAKYLKSMKPKVMLAHLDATVHTDIAEKFNIDEYPILLFFKDGVS